MASLTNEPETFQHYQVMRRDDGALWELGRGAMGVTYKAFDMNLRAPVALKVINALHLESETSRARFVREARAAAGLRHRNVASVYHLGHDEQSFFYAMEFVDGDTVEGLVKHQGVLKPAIALQIALQVSRALGAAAKQQLVHRDIKPANLMVVSEDDDEDQLIVKVIDFGLARPALGGEGSAHITMGGFVGTPQYASPEQLEEKELDARSDIYSLGITLWYMLVGRPPFAGALGSVFIQQLTKEPPWEHLAGTPEPVKKLLAHMLAKEPEKRPQSPTALRREIEACLKKLPSESGRIVLPPTGASPTTGSVAPETSAPGRTEAPSEAVLTSAPENPDTLDVTSTQTATPATGSILVGRYALDAQIGEGNNGRVFRARDLGEEDALVAVKIFHRGVLEQAAEVGRLEANLAKLRSVPHPNLLRFHDFQDTGDTRFLVSEWVTGFNLVELLRARGSIGAREVLLLLQQAAAAADHAKAAQLDRVELGLHQILVDYPVHSEDGDETASEIKTALTLAIDRWPSFAVKLDASGIFREAGDSVTLAGDMTMLPRDAGLIRDTQTSIRGLVADSHVFSLAALAYELLNGSPPAQGHLDEGHDSRYVALPALNETGNALLRKALSSNPGFSTCTEFFRDLVAASGVRDDFLSGDHAAVIPASESSGVAAVSEEGETLVMPSRVSRGPEPEADESSAATLIFHDVQTASPQTLSREEIVVTARSVEPAIPAETTPPEIDEPPDGADAPTLQGYSFLSRAPQVFAPGEPGAEDSHAPIVEKDDYGSDEGEAPTLQGYSFKTSPAPGQSEGVEPPAIEIVHDSYGSEDENTETPTLETFSFKHPSTGQLAVIAAEIELPELEAPTLQGYSFKAGPASAPEIVVAKPVTPENKEPADFELAELDTPTLQNFSFKSEPAESASPVSGTAGGEVSLEPPELEAPTLEGYSFKAGSAGVVVPSPSSEINARQIEPAPDNAPPQEWRMEDDPNAATLLEAPLEKLSETPLRSTGDEDLPATLVGVSLNKFSDPVVGPSDTTDPGAETMIDFSKPGASPTIRVGDDDQAAATLVDIPLTKLPDTPIPESEFLTVADAPLVPLPPRPVADTDTGTASALVDEAASSAPQNPPSASPAGTETNRDREMAPARGGIGSSPTVRPVTARPLNPDPAPDLVDRPIPEDVPVKTPNYALIGIAAAVVILGLIGVVFATRGKHPDETPVPAHVEKVAGADQRVPLGNAVQTPVPVVVQPTPGPTPGLAVQTSVAPSDSPPPQTSENNPPSVLADQPLATVNVPPPSAPQLPPVVAVAETKEPVDQVNPPSTPPLKHPQKEEDEDKASSAENNTRRPNREPKPRDQPVPTPRATPPAHDREPKPTPDRVAKAQPPKPPPPKPVAKKDTPKPAAPEPDQRPRGPAVPFMR